MVRLPPSVEPRPPDILILSAHVCVQQIDEGVPCKEGGLFLHDRKEAII